MSHAHTRQGAIYPDVIESVGKGAKSGKSDQNVGAAGIYEAGADGILMRLAPERHADVCR